MGILNKETELKKEREQFKKEESYYVWWFVFLFFMIGITVWAVFFWHD